MLARTGFFSEPIILFEACRQQVEQASGIKLRNADKSYELNARKVFKL